MRVGLFGGTFNPVHNAHLRTALDVVEKFKLDKLFLIPSSIPPHKRSEETESAKSRYEMLKLACEDARFIVSDVEFNRSGPSYTVDTIDYFLKKDYNELFFLIGTDAFLEIDLWKNYKKLLKKISFIIMKRPDVKDEISILKRYIQDKIGKYNYSEDKKCFSGEENKELFLTNVTQLNISSTNIRDLIKKGDSIKHLVCEKVEDYIISKGLYR
ncbi:MAG: nicotinate (nicotinamide) nucleotide adenylyltransferase [Deltaproteobacteria bacterium]|nr:nicotinate (nicotinamide) nucleotide adenylyltransferase [Deltaproteobacteria bacterium]